MSEYETKTINENGYEAHKQYIDIQAILSGEERVLCLPIDILSLTKPYRADIDTAFLPFSSLKTDTCLNCVPIDH